MLISIHIENIAVIKSIDVDFSDGFNVLTGQTGAGKSIIIDSINLIMGARADRDLIRSGEERAFVSAVFSVGDAVREYCAEIGIVCEDELMISREVLNDGKSIAKVNGRSVSATILREIATRLVTIHGQHDNQDLLRPECHIDFLDGYCSDLCLLEEYSQAYKAYVDAKSALDSFIVDEKDKARRIDLIAYQLKDIDGAKLKIGEEEKLTETKKKLKNSEKINKNTSLVYRALYSNDKGVSACALIERAISAVEALQDVYPEAHNTAEKLEECRTLITDIAHSVDAVSVDITTDPEALLTKIESRLALIERLKSKYGTDVTQILEYANGLRQELEALENADERLAHLREDYQVKLNNAIKCGKKLTDFRREVAARLSSGICEQLDYLDMAKVRFCVDFSHCETPMPYGTDSVEFLISANAGEELHPLAKVASGGELSRVMLAMKCVFAEIDTVSLMIFDEIDAGISGKTSVKIGKKLRELSRNYQIMCVTHSAQIASLAKKHFLISKSESEGRVFCRVDTLDYEGRVAEISRIIGGEVITETILASARELLATE